MARSKREAWLVCRAAERALGRGRLRAFDGWLEVVDTAAFHHRVVETMGYRRRDAILRAAFDGSANCAVLRPGGVTIVNSIALSPPGSD